jgi:gluconate 5-dehydrogenase
MASQTNGDSFRLNGEVALITGGGTGLGLAMARAFVQAGARVVIAGRREQELAQATAELGPEAFSVVHDVSATKGAPVLVARASELAGVPVSILVNNAGIHLKKDAVATAASEFATVLQTHVLGAHALAAAVLPGMMERRHGCILFIASMASLFGIPKVVAYSAAKSAHLGMVRTLAVEAGSYGVRVNAIAPGWIDSAMSRKALDDDPARKAKILGRTPLGRLGDAEDIGSAAVYLCSPAAKFVTGVVLPVDGGISIGF